MPIDRGPTIERQGRPGDFDYVPPRHPKHAYVENGMRTMDGERRVFPTELEGVDVIWINSGGFSDGKTVAVIELSAEGLEYLANELPDYDRFTKDLQYAATMAKEIIYDREVGIAK